MLLEKVNWKTIGLSIFLNVIILFSLSCIILPVMNKSWEQRLQEAILACPYSITEYRENVFDCSNMANMLDDWLEEKYGYETYIMIFQGENGVGHTLVVANGRFIEPTSKSLIFTFRKETYSNLLAFGIIMIDDVERLIDFYGESLWMQEWSYPKRW